MATVLLLLLGSLVVGAAVVWRIQRRYPRQSPTVVHLEQALERAVSTRDVSEEALRRPITPRTRVNTPSRAMRACPSCSQHVHRVATSCRHCGEALA